VSIGKKFVCFSVTTKNYTERKILSHAEP